MQGSCRRTESREYLQAQSSYLCTVRALTIAVSVGHCLCRFRVPHHRSRRGEGRLLAGAGGPARVASGDLTARSGTGKANWAAWPRASTASRKHSNPWSGGIRSSSDPRRSRPRPGCGRDAKQIADGTDPCKVQQTSQVAAAMEEMSATVIEVTKKNARRRRRSPVPAGVVDSGSGGRGRSADDRRDEADLGGGPRIGGGNPRSLGKVDGSQEIVGGDRDVLTRRTFLRSTRRSKAARAGSRVEIRGGVADEVRKLAGGAAKATREISEMIAAIQRDTGSAVKAMESGTRR